MRYIFKTDYDQDIRLAKHGGQVFWYTALLVLLLARLQDQLAQTATLLLPCMGLTCHLSGG